MQHLQDFISTAQAYNEEKAKRLAIELSDEYTSLSAKIEELKAQQEALYSGIPDSSQELALCKAALIAEMKENQITSIEGIEVKTRQNKRVDTRLLMEELGGDWDAYETIVTATQKSVTDFAKANPQWSNIKRAIIDDGVTISDISLPL